MEGYRKIAVYNGNSWDMGDIEPGVFLNEALVPSFPDLRGATWSENVNHDRREVTIEFRKAAGTKGLQAEKGAL